MAAHNNVIVVSIVLAALAPTVTAFGNVMVASLTLDSSFTDTVRTYTSQEEVDADETALGATCYALVSSIFEQENTPAAVKVGKLTPLVAEVNTLTITAVGTTGQEWIVSVLGEEVSYEVQGGDAVGDVASGLATLINAISGVSAAAVGAALTITAATAGQPLDTLVTGVASNGTYTLTDATALVSVGTGLDAIEAADSNWFYLLLENRGAINIGVAAEWVQGKEKLFIAETVDAAVLAGTSGNIAEVLQAEEYQNVGIVYHDDSAEFPAAAWVGRLAGYGPDSTAAVWHNMPLTGITEVGATATQASTLNGLNANWFDDLRGNGVMNPGKACDGTYLDLVVLKYWLTADIRQKLANFLTRTSNRGERVPYTNGGIAQCQGIISGALGTAQEIGHLASFNVPDVRVADVSSVDRAARILRLTFTAEPSGAVRELRINGSIEIPT